VTLLLSLCLTVPQDFSKGPPVVLFPSLAGSVLECQASPVEGFDLGTRIWMGLSTLLGATRCRCLTPDTQDSQSNCFSRMTPLTVSVSGIKGQATELALRMTPGACPILPHLSQLL